MERFERGRDLLGDHAMWHVNCSAAFGVSMLG